MRSSGFHARVLPVLVKVPRWSLLPVGSSSNSETLPMADLAIYSRAVTKQYDKINAAGHLSLNILIKLVSIVALVFAPLFL